MCTDGRELREMDAIITEDPLTALPIGSQVQFNAQLFPTDVPQGLKDVNNWEFFQGAVIAPHFGDAASQRILGSGVIVAPGIALVARHLAEPETAAILTGDGFICSAMTAAKVMIWRPHHITLIPSSDLA